MKVKLLKAWNGISAGCVIDQPDGVALILIARDIAEEVEAVETKVVHAAVKNKSRSKREAVKRGDQ